MIKFYNCNEINQWWQDFQKDTNSNIDIEHIDVLKTWIKKMDCPLSHIYDVYAYSVNAECFILNDNTIIKSNRILQMTDMYIKTLKYPNINDYIVPTYVFAFKNPHDFSEQHIQFIKNCGCEHILKFAYSDCLVLQPKCELIKNEQIFLEWLKEQENLNCLKQNKIDLKYDNAGYLNGEIKLFDW